MVNAFDVIVTDFGPVRLSKKTAETMDAMAPGWRLENKVKRWKSTKAGKAAAYYNAKLVAAVSFAAQLAFMQGKVLNEY